MSITDLKFRMARAIASAFVLVVGWTTTLVRAADFTGDVCDVCVVRRMEQHPGAALLWEPSIAVWKAKHIVVTYGAGIPGKTDMGDVWASVSTNDGSSWSEPVPVFDHNQRYGAVQFAYANSVLYKPPEQDVMWCFAMRCPMSYPDSEDSHLAAAFSADGGRSWTPVEPAMHYTGPLITVSGGVQRIMETASPATCCRCIAARSVTTRWARASSSCSAARACWSGGWRGTCRNRQAAACSCRRETWPPAIPTVISSS